MARYSPSHGTTIWYNNVRGGVRHLWQPRHGIIIMVCTVSDQESQSFMTTFQSSMSIWCDGQTIVSVFFYEMCELMCIC